jgi:ATP-dependent protease Clp ATPase subunit
MSNGGNCSFCGKAAHEVFRLIAGPTCNICSECVGRSANMIAAELQEAAAEILTLQPLPPESQGGAE